MIFPTSNKVAKGKSVKATAHFSAMESAKGKIVTQDANNVQIFNGLKHFGGFVQKDSGILQYLCKMDGEDVVLKSSGLVVGVRTFTQLANHQHLQWAFDVNQSTLIVSGKNATYKIFSGNIHKISDISFQSLAVCQSRLFGLKDNKVYMSAPTEMTFDADLWIELPSPCVALVNNGELYALGNDVYRLHLDGESSRIKVDKICANVGSVVASTVCPYGNKIVFVANNKVMFLQHGTLKVVNQLQGDAICATMHFGLYFVSTQSDDKHTVISYNLHNGKVVTMHHVTAKNICSNDQSLIASDGQNAFELSTNATTCHWASAPINFDDNPTTKHLHRLVVQTAYDVDVHVTSNTRRSYHFKGKDTPQSILIVGHGKNIWVEIASQGPMNVKYLSLTARPSEVSV